MKTPAASYFTGPTPQSRSPDGSVTPKVRPPRSSFRSGRSSATRSRHWARRSPGQLLT